MNRYKAFHSRLEDEVEELEEQGEEEESCGGGEAVDEAEVVHVVAVLGVDLQGRQEPETNNKIEYRVTQVSDLGKVDLIWGIPAAGRPQLWLPNAQAVPYAYILLVPPPLICYIT